MNKQNQITDIEDIDAFLKQDASQAISKIDDATLLAQPVSKLPRTTDPVKRLHSRLTHIFRNVNTVQENKGDLAEALNHDQQFSDDFTQDIEAWEVVLDDLEGILPVLAEAICLPEQADSQADKILMDVASHIDTFVQEAQDPDADNDISALLNFEIDDSSFNPQPNTLNTAASEVKAHISAEPNKNKMDANDMDANKMDECNLNDNDMDECNLSDTDATMNREQDQLLRNLRASEARIRDLESKLSSLNVITSKATTPEEETPATPHDENGLYVNRLFVVTCNDETLKYPLTKQIMTIGREPLNDIHIRSRYISRYHARIVCDQDGTVIEDLDSRNGITVNSRKVRRKQLKSGDLVDIGRVQFKYIDLMEGSSGEGSA